MNAPGQRGKGKGKRNRAPVNPPFDDVVQVIRPFAGEGEVICTETPAGEVVMTAHIGSYAGLPSAHNVIHSWRAMTGRAFGGCSWEVYGDWNENESNA